MAVPARCTGIQHPDHRGPGVVRQVCVRSGGVTPRNFVRRSGVLTLAVFTSAAPQRATSLRNVCVAGVRSKPCCPPCLHIVALSCCLLLDSDISALARARSVLPTN